MASQTITSVASTSTAPDNAITNVPSESTEKQRINIKKQKDEINYNLATWWLRMVEPRRAPYFPQRKDKIVYLRRAHEYYLKEIIDHKIFDVKKSDKLWIQMNILDYEYLTVVNVSFKRYPTRVACLEVKKCIKETEDTNEPVFELKYHDMEGVVDFLVLKDIFDEGLVMDWNVGDPFRYLIDNMWFSGTIVSIKPHYQKSPFKSFQIKWDDEEELDQISPWGIQRINKTRLPKNHGESVEVLNIEIVKMRYESCPDDWPNWEDWKATIKDIIPEFDLLIDLPISKCFIEIKNDPIYDALVSYPVDLSTIRERIHNHFYRRIDSLLLDIFYLKDNAKKHKSEKFFKEAELIAQACLDILYKGEVNLEELLENIVSIESDNDNEYKIFGFRNEKEGKLSYKDNWKMGCSLLLNILGDSEDMYPFRQPVSREDYPDYYKEIVSPICFEEINTKFHSNLYKSQKKVFEDIELIISNSYKFNQVEESAIYYATKGVEALFKELRKHINSKKEISRKNKPILSLREKQKNLMRKPNEETIVCQKEKEKDFNTRIIIKENKGKENKSTIKENFQEKDSIKRKQSHDEHNYNKRHKIKTNSLNMNDNEEEHQKLTNSCLNHSEIQTSTDSFNLRVIQEEQEHQDPSQSCSNVDVDLAQLQNHSIENRDKDVNDSSQKQSKQTHHNNRTIEKSLVSSKANSINVNGDEEKHRKVAKSCTKTGDFTQLQAHCTESTNQMNLEPKSSQILRIGEIGGSIDLFNLQANKEQEHQEPPQGYNNVHLTQSQNHSVENRDKDVNDSSRKNSNVKKSIASLKARKQMQLKYKRIFQHRPHKSCDLCQCIKQTFLAHLKSHHTFNIS